MNDKVHNSFIDIIFKKTINYNDILEVGHVGSIYDKFKVDSKLIHETANHLVDPGTYSLKGL